MLFLTFSKKNNAVITSKNNQNMDLPFIRSKKLSLRSTPKNPASAVTTTIINNYTSSTPM